MIISHEIMINVSFSTRHVAKREQTSDDRCVSANSADEAIACYPDGIGLIRFGVYTCGSAADDCSLAVLYAVLIGMLSGHARIQLMIRMPL